MAEIIEVLEQRVEATKTALDDVLCRLQQMENERDKLRADLEGYQRALAAEKRLQGLVEVQDEFSPSDDGMGEPAPKKAAFARDFIQKHSATGVTPHTLFRGFQVAGIPIKMAYIYSLLMRLKAAKSIRVERGKYFFLGDSNVPS